VFQGRDGKEWHVICIQAQAEEGKNDPLGRQPGEWLWLEWFDQKFWEETQRAQMLSDVRNWSALYQQRPSPEEGSFFKKEWFRWYDTEPKHLNKYGASDYAVTEDGGDFTEHVVFGVSPDDDVYVVDWWSGQKQADIWIETQIDLMQTHGPFIWAGEGGPIRRSVEPFLVKRMKDRKTFCQLEWISDIADKPSKARSFPALCSMGKFYLPKGKPWAEELVSQLLRFPAASVDDKADVCGLFGRLLDRVWKSDRPEVKAPADILAQPTLNDILNERPKKNMQRRI
jgi:predicted phage terminase large subunit-like protein